MSDAMDLRARLGSAARPLSAAEYARIARELGTAADVPGTHPLRIGVLSSCSLQFIEPSLVVEALRRDLHVRVHFGPFGQFEQEISNPASALHGFNPGVVLLFMRPEDLDADVYARHYAPGRPNVLNAVVDRLEACVDALRARTSATVLVANFAAPAHTPLGPFDGHNADSIAAAVQDANRELQRRLASRPGTVVWDYAAVVRNAGADQWCDPRLWSLARIPVAADRQAVLSRQLARTLAALVRTPAKCLVLDLDNTLWGGVIGDDGMEGIQLGDDYPGSVFKSFQRVALGLADRGILLAIVSKNDSEVVNRALREHPEMLIRPEHVAAMRVNWSPKSGNLREIAKELNIGLDALVMFDDNPVERAEIAANAPEVKVVDVPTDPLGYERALYDCGFFDMITVSDEDRKRVQMYRDDRAREEVRATTGTTEEFLTGLAMVAAVAPVEAGTIGRVAQLVAKTNQFNLTTRRYSQAQIADMCSDGNHVALQMRLRDRFGDLGLIATALMRVDADEAVIDTFIMSCRAMGRGAEVGLMSELAAEATARGCRYLVGEYIPTARNHIVADLFPQLGFEAAPAAGDATRFRLDLARSTVEWPATLEKTGSDAAAVV